TPTAIPPQINLTCDQLVADALQLAGPSCSGTERNQACYGNNQVNAEFREGLAEPFSTAGDLASLLGMRAITTSALSEAEQVWGEAFVTEQADLTDSHAGQDGSFLLYGGASADDIEPHMQAVVHSTGFGGTTCNTLRPSSVLQQSPTGTQVAMNTN